MLVLLCLRTLEEVGFVYGGDLIGSGMVVRRGWEEEKVGAESFGLEDD